MALVKTDVSENVSPSSSGLKKYTPARKSARRLITGNRLTLFLAGVYIFYPEDEGDIFLRNAAFKKTHTAPHPRRRHSSLLRGLSPCANYTDRATAACRRS
jgi:hypothetical protein